MNPQDDVDITETREWIDALKAVQAHRGVPRTQFLLGKLREEALRTNAMPPFLPTTPYRNTIPPEQEAKSPATGESSLGSPTAMRGQLLGPPKDIETAWPKASFAAAETPLSNLEMVEQVWACAAPARVARARAEKTGVRAVMIGFLQVR